MSNRLFANKSHLAQLIYMTYIQWPRISNIGQNEPIRTWKQFARKIRSNGCNLLRNLDNFPDSILVTGCQRSGTTMLARIIFQSEDMVNYWVGRDDELDAALILSGQTDHPLQGGRYCFQTTYINECYEEYFKHEERFKVIWVLRNPFSVVYSMLHNWKRFAFNELFDACGARLLETQEKERYDFFGQLAISKLRRACLAYNGKTVQVFDLVDRLGSERVFVIDYDHLVEDKERVLPAIYEFIDLPYRETYGQLISKSSLRKAQRLSRREKAAIELICTPIYERAKSSLTLSSSKLAGSL